MNEIDISEKVKRAIKFGLPALLLLSVAVASIVWYALYGTGDLVVRDARVSSSMVGARVRVAGTVSEVLVKDGDAVKAGDVIARIKVNVTEEQLKQLQQTVELTQKNLDQLKQGITVRTPRVVSAPASAGASAGEVERARSRMERMNQLYEMGAVSAVKRDEAAAAYQAALAAGSGAASASYDSNVVYDTTVQAASPEAIKKAELQLRQAQAALERAKGSAAATEITAPVDGTVYIGELAEGMEVQAGQVLANVGNSDSMWIEAYLEPEQQDSVRLGQVADYYVDRKKYEGLVMEINQPVEDEQQEAAGNTEGSYGEAASGKLVVRISISPEDASGMKIGENAEVRFLKKG